MKENALIKTMYHLIFVKVKYFSDFSKWQNAKNLSKLSRTSKYSLVVKMKLVKKYTKGKNIQVQPPEFPSSPEFAVT